MASQNKIIIEDLKKIIINDDKNVIAFVGAGTSIIPGINNWDNLLIEMAIEFEKNVTNQKSIEQIKENVLTDIAINGYSKTASLIYDKIKNLNKYKAFLKKQFIPNKTKYHATHTKILNIFKIILTTNYDICFEDSLDDINYSIFKYNGKKINVEIQRLPYFNSSNLKHDGYSLVYLHSNSIENNYILKEDEYKLNYPSAFNLNHDSQLETFLKDIFENFTIVFIGFSFNDSVFKQFVENYIKNRRVYYEEYKLINGNDPMKKLQNNFIILHSNECKVTIDKKILMRTLNKFKINIKDIFKEDKSDILEFNNSFNDLSIQEFKAKEFPEEFISFLQNEYKKKVAIDEKLNFFDNFNINLIKIDDYIEIEAILKSIRKELSYIKSDSMEASIK